MEPSTSAEFCENGNLMALAEVNPRFSDCTETYPAPPSNICRATTINEEELPQRSRDTNQVRKEKRRDRKEFRETVEVENQKTLTLMKRFLMLSQGNFLWLLRRAKFSSLSPLRIILRFIILAQRFRSVSLLFSSSLSFVTWPHRVS